MKRRLGYDVKLEVPEHGVVGEVRVGGGGSDGGESAPDDELGARVWQA